MRSTTLAQGWPQKSTNGRSSIRSGDWPRLAFQLLGWVAPEVAMRRALRRFLTPPAPSLAAAKLPHFEGISDDRFRVAVTTSFGGIEETTSLQVALWGRGPAVYLAHGWGGRS